METIDGKYTLKELESAIQFQEAGAKELTSLKKAKPEPPTNQAVFKKLEPGEIPDDFHLTLDPVPYGKKEVWSGEVFIEGKATKAKGYRGD